MYTGTSGRVHLSSATSFPKYPKFPSHMTIFGTSYKRPHFIRYWELKVWNFLKLSDHLKRDRAKTKVNIEDKSCTGINFKCRHWIPWKYRVSAIETTFILFKISHANMAKFWPNMVCALVSDHGRFHCTLKLNVCHSLYIYERLTEVHLRRVSLK